jgi:hypothetical protein
MQIKIYLNAVSFDSLCCCDTIQEYNQLLDLLLNTTNNKNHIVIGDNTFNIIFKNKYKVDWCTNGHVCFHKKGVNIFKGVYLKQDLRKLISFKDKMIDMILPEAKQYLNPVVDYCFPNKKESRILVEVSLK